MQMDRRPTEKSHCHTEFSGILGGDHLCLQRRKLEGVIWLREFPSAEARSRFSYPLLLPVQKKAVDVLFSIYLGTELVTPISFCRGPLNSYHMITALGSS